MQCTEEIHEFFFGGGERFGPGIIGKIWVAILLEPETNIGKKLEIKIMINSE